MGMKAAELLGVDDGGGADVVAAAAAGAALGPRAAEPAEVERWSEPLAHVSNERTDAELAVDADARLDEAHDSVARLDEAHDSVARDGARPDGAHESARWLDAEGAAERAPADARVSAAVPFQNSELQPSMLGPWPPGGGTGAESRAEELERVGRMTVASLMAYESAKRGCAQTDEPRWCMDDSCDSDARLCELAVAAAAHERERDMSVNCSWASNAATERARATSTASSCLAQIASSC